jgi:hypothetical protein
MNDRRQGALGEDDQAWQGLAALDDARLEYYSRTGHYVSVGVTATIERARRYVAKLPPAVSGQRGRAALWTAVCACVHGFELDPRDAEQVIREYNRTCVPPYDDHEITATCWRAARRPDKLKPRGYLLRGER